MVWQLHIQPGAAAPAGGSAIHSPALAGFRRANAGISREKPRPCPRMKAALRASLMRHLTVTPAGSITSESGANPRGLKCRFAQYPLGHHAMENRAKKHLSPYLPCAPLANRPRKPPRGSHKSDRSGDTPSARCRLGLVVVYWKNTSLPGNKKGSAP